MSASQAERRRFESGHPLIISGLKICCSPAIISLGTGHQHTRALLRRQVMLAIGETLSPGFSPPGRFMA
jgi:hypothetical protein